MIIVWKTIQHHHHRRHRRCHRRRCRCLAFRKINPEGVDKNLSKIESTYRIQSAQSETTELSFNKTTLKRCNITEIR